MHFQSLSPIHLTIVFQYHYNRLTQNDITAEITISVWISQYFHQIEWNENEKLI